MAPPAEASALGSVFVDYENLVLSMTNQYNMSKSDAVVRVLDVLGNIEQTLAERGVRIVRREAFADWSEYPASSKELYRMGYRTRNVGATIHKNSADIELSLSVHEVMLQSQSVRMMVIAAGDRDYMPIAMRAIESAKDLMFVSFRESLSGDLRELVGPNGYLYIDPESGALFSPGADSKAGRFTAAREAPPKGLTLDEELALKSAISSYDEYKPKYGDARLSGFLVIGLAKALPRLTHLERKAIFNSLQKKGTVRTAMKEFQGETFTVFHVVEESSTVKEERRRMGV